MTAVNVDGAMPDRQQTDRTRADEPQALASDPGRQLPLLENWPDLPAQVLNQGWQAALNGGPEQIAKQVAYALAFSRQRGVTEDAPGLSAAEESGEVQAGGAVARAALGEVLSPAERQALFDELVGLPPSAAQVRGLCLLAPFLAGIQRVEAVQKALEVAQNLAEPAFVAAALTDLIPLVRQVSGTELPGGLMAETLDIASQIQGMNARLRSLTALAPYLPATIRVGLMLAVLDTIAMMRQSEAQASALVALAPYLLDEVHHRALAVTAHIQDPAARARVFTALARDFPSQLQPRLRAAALEAIASIPNEFERARALAAFAPHLDRAMDNATEFPVLLEQALGLTIDLTRPEARARALVGLQAQLPRHLQVEALAVLRRIPDEHERADLLADLMPYLPEELVAGAALEAAREMRQRDARLLALIAVGKRLAGDAAAQVWQEALDVALALPRQLEQVLALAELAPHLPDEDLRQRALQHALATASSIGKERARLRALAALAPLLAAHPDLLGQALEIARAITNPVEKVSALIALVPHFATHSAQTTTIYEVLTELLEVAREYRQSRALINLAPFLAGETLERALETAVRIEDPNDRVATLAALIPRLDDPARQAALVEQALGAAHAVTDPYDRVTALVALRILVAGERRPALVRAVLQAVREIEDDYDRASGIALLAPLLNDTGHRPVLASESQVLRGALLAACRIPDAEARAHALIRLLPYWEEAHPPEVAYALWREVLVQLSRRAPGHLLRDLAVLMPVVRRLGGPDVLRALQAYLTAASRW
ncbi:MAG: hypothetical protein Kow0077_10850 [Anaerolineae bacterium]